MAKQSEWDKENVSAKGERSNGDGGQKTDAIEMLKSDHRRVEQLFDKYEQARRRAEKAKLAQQICLELTIHAELEEEIFYPACREHVDDPLLDEAQVEHDTAKILIAEIAMGTPTADPMFDAKVSVLGEYVRHHVQEEEKSAESIFNKAQEGGVDTAALGRRMAARREELMDEFSQELLLPQPKALHVTLAQDEEVWAGPPSGGRGMRGARGGRGMEERSTWEREGEEGRGWAEREEGAYDERRSARGGGREGERGWHGEPERHAQAARRGREEREGGGGRSRGREEERGGARGEEDRGAMARGQERGQQRGEERGAARGGGQERGAEHRGWRGDPRGHSEASRRGWEHRR
ncbi:hemerythrin domain-containing protein [Methylocystis echinoides]|jgi:hemerythrin superfamily protein|uniref:hemerythrin domain-containing protein n=1 Tax=Methylocystis echinoides TaxID=29468 RepID=UPI00343AF69A